MDETRVSLENGVLTLDGLIDFKSVISIRETGNTIIDQLDGQVVIDLEGIDGYNSACVALLVAWYRRAASQKKSFECRGIPKELFDIIGVYGLESVIPWTNS